MMVSVLLCFCILYSCVLYNRRLLSSFFVFPVMYRYTVLCYAMLCYAMLCYAMLCYAMLCYAMLCYAMLCYVVLCYAVLCLAMLIYSIRLEAATLRVGRGARARARVPRSARAAQRPFRRVRACRACCACLACRARRAAPSALARARRSLLCYAMCYAMLCSAMLCARRAALLRAALRRTARSSPAALLPPRRSRLACSVARASVAPAARLASRAGLPAPSPPTRALYSINVLFYATLCYVLAAPRRAAALCCSALRLAAPQRSPLRRAALHCASLRRPRHSGCPRRTSQGADAEGDAQGADAEGADAQGADAEGADVEGADARGAYAEGADQQTPEGRRRSTRSSCIRIRRHSSSTFLKGKAPLAPVTPPFPQSLSKTVSSRHPTTACITPLFSWCSFSSTCGAMPTVAARSTCCPRGSFLRPRRSRGTSPGPCPAARRRGRRPRSSAEPSRLDERLRHFTGRHNFRVFFSKGVGGLLGDDAASRFAWCWWQGPKSFFRVRLVGHVGCHPNKV